MSKEYESADLLLKVYDLRREEKMREARNWWWRFNPKSFEEINAVWSTADSGKLGMVPAYWNMVAALVNHKAIDEKMFLDTNREFMVIFVKMQPFLEDMRKHDPEYLVQLEKLVMRIPGIEKRIKEEREFYKMVEGKK